MKSCTFVLFGLLLAAGAPPVAWGETCLPKAEAMRRLELFFGTSIKGAATVSPRAFSQFVAREVTPRFPDGLTIFDAHGQWRTRSGSILRETSHLIVILYKPDATSDQRIEAIRAAYEKRFHQDSVMRVESTACVEF